MAFGVVLLFDREWGSGALTIFMGMFLNGAAKSGYQQVLVRQALQGEPVRRFMNTEPIVVAPSLDLFHWVEDFVYHYHHRAFPVVNNGRLEGLITTQALNQVPRTAWTEHTVGELMTDDLDAVTISADADALEALEKMQQTSASRLLVMEGNHLVGMISLKDLLRFLNLKLELEGRDDVASGPDDSTGPRRRERTFAHPYREVNHGHQ